MLQTFLLRITSLSKYFFTVCQTWGFCIITGDFFEEWNEIAPQTHMRKFEEQMA